MLRTVQNDTPFGERGCVSSLILWVRSDRGAYATPLAEASNPAVRGITHPRFASGTVELTAELFKSIRRALEADDVTTAMNLYRAAVPKASYSDAQMGLVELMIEHRPLSFATLNGESMGKCAVVEAVILGVFWAIMTPSHPAWFAAPFAYIFLFIISIGIIAGAGVKDSWKQVLLLVPAIALAAVTEVIRSNSADAPTSSVTACFFGFICGLMLMVAGSPWPRINNFSKK